MIDAGYVRVMAAYNSEMNRRLYAAAARLSDAQRRAEAGAFWGSIHATLSHLLWADTMWMSRFDGWAKPGVPLKDSGRLMADFDAMQAARVACDAGIEAWAADVDAAWIAGRMSWFSGATQRDITADRDGIVVHFFNHQTHHRGQVHALLTRAGQATGDTDLFIVLPPD